MPTLYVQVPGITTASRSPLPVPGLSLDIPEGLGLQALVIMNAPQASATGGNVPGGCFVLSVDGARVLPALRFGGNSPQMNNVFVPCTLVVAVPLKPVLQKVQVECYCDPEATLSTGPASLTVLAD